MRLLIAILVVMLTASSSAFPRKTSHHHLNRVAQASVDDENRSRWRRAIPTTSRSIEISEAFAGDAKPQVW
jgi:hypothetical protein